MICNCHNDEISSILSYVDGSYYKCLYLYLNIQKYGCSSDTTQTWKQTIDGEVTSVMLAYHSALHIYSKSLDFDVQELVNFILKRNPTIVCATAELIRLLVPYLTSLGYSYELGYIGKHVKSIKQYDSINISLADKNDIKQIAKLLYEDEDIGASYTLDDLERQIEERLNDGYVRSYVIRDSGHVVAHLGTGAETDSLCTISYVITAPDYRGKGLSTALFSYSCERLEEEGKEIYSIYYPENSRRLHHKMGFVDCCEFGKLFKNIR